MSQRAQRHHHRLRPGRAHRRHLHRPGQPRPLVIEGEPSSHQRPARRPADAHHRRRELPRLPRRDHGPRADDASSASRPSASAPSSSPTKVDRGRLLRAARSGSGSATTRVPRPTSVIISTGAQSLMLGLEPSSALLGHGVSTCATCDGFFFRDHEIAVVGGGDSAVEEAIFLTKFADKVTLDPPPRRAAGLEDHAGPGVRQPQDRVPVEHRRRRRRRRRQARGRRSSATSTTGETSTLPVDRAVRRHRPPPEHRPVQGPARHGRQRLPRHRSPARPYTNVDGVFACGDVQDHTYRQAITAAGSGLHGRHRRRALARGQHADARPLRPAELVRRRECVRPAPALHRVHSTDPHRKDPPWPTASCTLTDATFDETIGGVRRRPSSSTSGPSGAGRAR